MMKKLFFGCLLTVWAVLDMHGAPDPYIGYLYPCGAPAGSKVRVLIGGQNLGANRVLISGSGVKMLKITPVPGFPQPDGSQRKYLIAWIRAIENHQAGPPRPEDISSWRKNPWWEKLDTLDKLELNLVVRDLHTKRNALQATPSLRQLLIVDLEIAADAPPGRREFRLASGRGVSNPKDFFVDSAPHLAEPAFAPPWQPRPQPGTVTMIPAVLDGQIMPGETDFFKLRLEDRQSISCRLYGRALQPYIGDAVPGFFQPVLELTDEKGRSVAFADDHGFDPDPVLKFTAPAAGTYTLAVRDNLYRGREDFVYRVEVISGLEPAAESPFRSPFGNGTPVDSNSALQTEWPVSECTVIQGVLAEPGRVDRYRVRGQAGDVAVFTVAAHASGSALDAVLTLRDAQGREVARNDDGERRWNIGVIPQAFDPQLAVRLAADGVYTLEVRDLTGRGGPDYGYFLKIAPPQPDFAVYSGASALNIPAGGTGRIRLFIERQDGFSAPLSVRSATAGLEIVQGGLIAGRADSAELLVRNTNRRGEPPKFVKLLVRGSVAGNTVEHRVIPADEYMQAFAYNHLVPARFWYLATVNPPGKKPAPPPAGARPKPVGGAAQK